MDAVTDETRRRALRILRETDGPLPMADLATELSRMQTVGEPGSQGEQAKEIRAALHHRHVPRLADAGLVKYDADQRTVTLTEVGAEMLALVDRLSPDE